MAAVVPEQLATPPLVQRQRGFSHRHPVMPGRHDQPPVHAERPARRPAGRSPRSGRSRRRTATPGESVHPAAPTATGARPIIALSPQDRRVHRHRVDPLLQMGHQRGHRTAQRQPGHRKRRWLAAAATAPAPRTSETARIIPATLVSGSMVGVGRPHAPTDTMAGLHRQGDVEAQLSMHPVAHRTSADPMPRPGRRRVSTPARAAPDRRGGTGVPPRLPVRRDASVSSALRQQRIVLERQALVT